MTKKEKKKYVKQICGPQYQLEQQIHVTFTAAFLQLISKREGSIY